MARSNYEFLTGNLFSKEDKNDVPESAYWKFDSNLVELSGIPMFLVLALLSTNLSN